MVKKTKKVFIVDGIRFTRRSAAQTFKRFNKKYGKSTGKITVRVVPV